MIVVDNASSDGSLEVDCRPSSRADRALSERRLRTRLQRRLARRPGSVRPLPEPRCAHRLGGSRAPRGRPRGVRRRVGAVAPRINHDDGTLDYSLRRFPRLRSTYARALFLHRIFPRATWTDELIREPECLRASRLAGLGLGRVHPRAPDGSRGARRLRRGLLHVLRGHRPVPPTARCRARASVRAGGGHHAHRRRLRPTCVAPAGPRGRAGSGTPASTGARRPRCSSASESRSRR